MGSITQEYWQFWVIRTEGREVSFEVSIIAKCVIIGGRNQPGFTVVNYLTLTLCAVGRAKLAQRLATGLSPAALALGFAVTGR